MLDGNNVSVSRSPLPESLDQGEPPGHGRANERAQPEGTGALRGYGDRGIAGLRHRGLGREQEQGTSDNGGGRGRNAVAPEEARAGRVPMAFR
jgi:hypothetical protein